MKFDLQALLGLLPVVGPVVARLPEFAERFEQLIAHHPPEDQAELRDALEDIRAENDAGHARLQAKLEAAKRR